MNVVELLVTTLIRPTSATLAVVWVGTGQGSAASTTGPRVLLKVPAVSIQTAYRAALEGGTVPAVAVMAMLSVAALDLNTPLMVKAKVLAVL